MKVAITSMGSGMDAELDPRFGRTRWIIVADTETGESSSHENTAAVEAAHGAGIQTADSVARLGVEALITGNMGPKAFRALEGAGIRVYSSGPATVAEALKNFLAGKLPELSAAAAGACGSGGAGFGPGGSGLGRGGPGGGPGAGAGRGGGRGRCGGGRGAGGGGGRR